MGLTVAKKHGSRVRAYIVKQFISLLNSSMFLDMMYINMILVLAGDIAQW
jgi:hypothetical protein